MAADREIVVTGLGVVSPIGIGVDPFWRSLSGGTSGVALCGSLPELGPRLAAEVRDFNPLEYVTPRKSLKVMARDSQLALAAARLAREHAGIGPNAVDPDRLASVFGADTINPLIEDSAQTYGPCMVEGKFHFDRWQEHGMPRTFPLNMLKLLPNMLTCHVSIAHDARGPCNTTYQGDVSSALAISESASLIERGMADVVLTGGASSRLQPLDWLRHRLAYELSARIDEPEHASRPFDRHRAGQVPGEGAGCMVLESAGHARRRDATVHARVLGWGSSCDVPADRPGAGLVRAIHKALARAALNAGDIDFVFAHAAGTREHDPIEAQAISDALPKAHVTALKSYFGNLFAAGGTIETIAAVLALGRGAVPATLNYRSPDPACPVRVLREPSPEGPRRVLVLGRTPLGQATALVLAAA
ncbi:MAG TPA: beta-ketoacyl-[acyl-carrier-protein] synthase family protein [Pirellulales bacterium]|nr:beta-ketoacyl-[acyl-carrier-protein] synthase family protein [Pirellulales bacterium]